MVRPNLETQRIRTAELIASPLSIDDHASYPAERIGPDADTLVTLRLTSEARATTEVFTSVGEQIYHVQDGHDDALPPSWGTSR